MPRWSQGRTSGSNYNSLQTDPKYLQLLRSRAVRKVSIKAMMRRRGGMALYRVIRRSESVLVGLVLAAGLFGCGQESQEIMKVNPTTVAPTRSAAMASTHKTAPPTQTPTPSPALVIEARAPPPPPIRTPTVIPTSD